jgi:hypothetical protein
MDPMKDQTQIWKAAEKSVKLKDSEVYKNHVIAMVKGIPQVLKDL